MRITTVAQARALKEEDTLLKPGIYLGARGVHGDDILLFRDADGETKKVECIRYTPDGEDVWVKVPFRL